MKTAVRKKPGPIENRLSMVFMAILVLVAAGVILRQFHTNPAVVALRPESHQHSLAPESNRAAVIDTAATGVVAFSPPEHFGPDSIYEKNNGRADLYLSSGFVALDTQRFSLDQASDNWVEVFVYDMGSPENAFSVFSMQRREDARPAKIVPNAYRTENALFMTHAGAYLELIGTDASQEIHKTIGILARQFVQAHGGTTTARAPGADLFPQPGTEPGSLQLIQANAFGVEILDQVYTCEYNLDGARLTAFVSHRSDAVAVPGLADDYRQTLLTYGATVVDSHGALESAVVLQFFDTYEIVFSKGRYLAGVHEADNLEAAKILAQRLFDHLGAPDAKQP